MANQTNLFKYFLNVDTDPKQPDLEKVLGIQANSTAQQIHEAAKKTIAQIKAKEPGRLAKEKNVLIDFVKKAHDRLIAKTKSKTDPSKPQKAESKKPESKKPATEKSATQSVLQPPSAATPPTKTTPEKVSPPAKSIEKPAATPSVKTGKLEKTQPVADASKKLPAEKVPTASVTAEANSKKTDSQSNPEGKSADDLKFTLDAPEEKDSFDSDTHLSANAFQVSSVITPTVDPMAPVSDPTEQWDSYSPDQIEQFDSPVAVMAPPTGTATITSAATETRIGPATSVNESPLPADASPVTTAATAPKVSERTFYANTLRKKSQNGLYIAITFAGLVAISAGTYIAIFGLPGGDSTGENKVAEKKDSNSKNGNSESSENKNTNDTKTPEKKSSEPTENKSEKKEPPKDDDGESKNGESKMEPPKKVAEMTEPKMEEPTVDPPKKEEPEEMKPVENRPEPKNSEIAELAQLLTDARQKLVERNIVESNRLLTKAADLPMKEEHQQKYERLQKIAELYSKFWDHVVEGCGKLKALDEIKFSETSIVKVVESSEEKIIYRALGQRFEKEPRELQVGIAMKIAENEMDPQEAETRMIKGAVFAIESITHPDRVDRATELWEEAKLQGGETDDLMVYLTDTYDLLEGSISKSKLPDESAIAEAQTRFRESYAAGLRTASRNQKASSDFAKQLLADVPKLDDAADRHANFTAALFYAGKSSELDLVLTALSDYNKWFSIDLEQVTYDTLSKFNKLRLKPEQKQEVMRTAFEYMDRSKKASKDELELQFAELALAAAKGAREPKLVQTATRELERVKANQQNK